MAKAAKVDDLPARKWKSPLQEAIQILKRHRDVMFQDARDSAPISATITTLAALSYRGEPDAASALERILTDMHLYVRQTFRACLTRSIRQRISPTSGTIQHAQSITLKRVSGPGSKPLNATSRSSPGRATLSISTSRFTRSSRRASTKTG